MYNIIVADDDEACLKILQLHLDPAIYNVIPVKNGEDVLKEIIKHADIDLILLDSMMPKMDGLKVLRYLKNEKYGYSHIPVILQTAKIQDYDVYEGLEAGAIHYIIKPYTREMLLSAVENVLRDVDAIKKHYVGGK